MMNPAPRPISELKAENFSIGPMFLPFLSETPSMGVST